MGSEYDAIVVGASFAGLAAARELHGRILLIDRKVIGEGQTSACGTALRKVEELGATEAVLQVHRALVIHGARETITYDLGDRPFCTFDYRGFCERLAGRLEATFLKAASWPRFFSGFWARYAGPRPGSGTPSRHAGAFGSCSERAREG